jgi:Domain of Unknown Function (DUF928)
MRIAAAITLAMIGYTVNTSDAQAQSVVWLSSAHIKDSEEQWRLVDSQHIAQNNNEKLIFNSTILAGKGNGGGGRWGGTGGDSQCQSGKSSLTAIVPMRQRGRSIITPVSQSAQIFWFYVPYASSQLTAEFSFRNTQDSRKTPYRKAYLLPGREGIIGIPLPLSERIIANQSYLWEFRVICSKTNPSINPVVDGVIEGVSTKLSLPLSGEKVVQSTIRYAQEGLWYETLTTIITKVRPTNPQKASVLMTELLQTYGLEEFAKEEIVKVYPITGR